MVPQWLHILSVATLLLGAGCALVIVVDEVIHPQHMWIMNVVWPITALFGTVFWLWAYFKYGRLATKEQVMRAKEQKHPPPNQGKPFPVMVGEAASHCGSGCTLGDIIAEWLAFSFPAIAVWLGWHTVFSEKIFAVWILDYIFAYLFGIFFQYYTIAPMRNLGFAEGIWAAIKADTLSLTAWQIGMYGFMAVAFFWIFRDILGTELKVNTPEFWFMMQIAMICGFITSYPVNWWLLRTGLKEKM
ncbi:MAG: DUF4396 domain-containing protein [Hyphomicrobium sp.]|uniref:DUF4396 domain-containing protein n=1 Tax=Hyphomicrobium sp. TaxID=82 RepID=UPI00356A1524